MQLAMALTGRLSKGSIKSKQVVGFKEDLFMVNVTLFTIKTLLNHAELRQVKTNKDEKT